MPNTSKVGAILAAKCPRCRKGEVFQYSAFNLPKFDRMHEQCPVCGLHYEVEVGFFWGAMYISYGFSVGIVLLVGVLLYYLAHDPPTWVYLAVVAACVLVLTPMLFRYARILMLHFSAVSPTILPTASANLLRFYSTNPPFLIKFVDKSICFDQKGCTSFLSTCSSPVLCCHSSAAF